MRTRHGFGLGTLALFFIALAASLTEEAGANADSARSVQAVNQADVRPLLQKYCSHCHGENKPKSDIRLDSLTVDFVKGDAGAPETWHDVLENLYRGEMPPKNQPQLSAKEHGIIVDWLNRAFREVGSHRNSNYPLVLVGGKNMGFRHGQYLKNPNHRPMADILLTMLQGLGVPVKSFADSTGAIAELRA